MSSSPSVLSSSDNSDTSLLRRRQIHLDGVHGLSIAIIIGQIVMIPAAKIASWMATQGWSGSRNALLLAYTALPLRGFIFGATRSQTTVIACSVLDGISGGTDFTLLIIRCDRRFSRIPACLRIRFNACLHYCDIVVDRRSWCRTDRVLL